MLNALIDFSLRNRFIVLLLAVLLVVIGARSAGRLPLDAFPDTTPVQVQINTVAAELSPEDDLKAERRPQVVSFYNQQFLTAAGVASSGLSDSLGAAVRDAASAARGAPKAARIGSLVAETIVLVNPQRNYAQFLLRALLPMVLHVIVTLAAGYSVGSEFRRRSMRNWLACAGGNPIVALTGKLAPLFAIFFVIMLTVPLVLEGTHDVVGLQVAHAGTGQGGQEPDPYRDEPKTRLVVEPTGPGCHR